MIRYLMKIFIITLLFMFSAFISKKEVTAVNLNDENQIVEYNSMNNYCYEIENPFVSSPDSFEAWIKLPYGSCGGTLMSNFRMPGTKYPGIVSWSINGFGKVNVYWNDGKFKHTFEHDALDDNKWHHIAVIRNEELREFVLYIDGIIVDSVICYASAVDSARIPMRVGVGHENYGSIKTPLEGYIKQITIYSGVISQERIKSDMQNTVITDNLDGNLIGNWYFGEKWSERIISESSGNGNDAKLCTFDKYVGVASGDFEYDYSLVVLGDVQAIVDGKEQLYYDMIQWIADNVENKKISCVVQTGDLTNSGTLTKWEINEGMYRVAAKGLSVLDNKVPYSFCPGNHDYDYVDNADRSQILFNTYFPYEKHSNLLGFSGAYISGDMANTYYTFNVCGINYLIINLEFEPRMPVIRWANRVCEMYPQHRVIINTHSYIGSDGEILDSSTLNSKDGGISTFPTELYDGLVKRHENIFMVLSGHVANDDALVRYDTGIHGNEIISFLINPQGVSYDKGIGEDLVFMMNFNESTGMINCYYYSPYHNAAWNIQNQFQLSFKNI